MDEFIKNLKSKIEEVKARAQKLLNEILNHKQEIYGSALNYIEDLVLKNMKVLEKVFEELDSLMGINPDLLPCVLGEKDNILKLLQQLRDGVLKCANTAVADVLKLQSLVTDLEDKITNQIGLLTDLLEKCGSSGNPIATFSCVIQNVRYRCFSIKFVIYYFI